MNREKMDKRLRESDERYRLLLDRALEGIWFTVYEEPIDITLPEMEVARLINETGVIVEANNTTAKEYGFDEASQLIGRHWSEFIPFEKNEEFYLKFVRSNYNMCGDITVEVDRAGNISYNENSLVGSIVDGKLVSSSGVGRDITQRIQAEEKCKTTFEHTGTAMAVFEEDTTISLVNHQFELQSGYSRQEIEGKKSWTELIHPEDRERMKEAHHRRREPGAETFSQYEFRFVDREGNIKHIFLTIDIIPGTKQSIASLIDITERKKAEEALSRKTDQQAAILSSIPASIYFKDTESKLISVNDAFAEMVNTPVDQLPGKDTYDLFPKAQATKFHIDDKTVMESGKAITDIEEQFTDGEGKTKWTSSSKAPYFDEKGKVVGMVGITWDITERKRREAEVKREKERSEAYLNIAGVILAIIDVDENISLINKKGCEILGYKVEELIGRNWFDTLVPKRIRAEIRGVFGKLTARDIEPVEHYENTLLTRDGEEKIIAFHNTVIRNPGGEISGILLSGEDVTQRKRAEEELRSSEERLNTIFEYAPDALYLNNLKGNFINGNKAAEEITGYKRDELIGKSFLKLKLLPAGQIPKAAALLAKNILRQPTGPDEFTLNRKDGTKVQVEISSYPTKIAGKTLALGIARDITQRKKMEEEKKELEQKAQLASRLATVGEMASGVAHEINNPLTGVIGFSQLLAQREDMSEDIKEKLEIIAEGGQRVASIVSRLLAFARHHKLERSYVDINELLENTLKLRAYAMHTSDIKLSTHLDSALPRTMADAGQLQQVFLNIIINAETEMKEAHGKGKLVVKTEAIDDTIRISFKDNGPGISPKNLDRLFEPFFTTREVGKGTGLGLSICHGIIAEHNGEIYASSNSGKGATFIVELPVLIEEKQLELARPSVDESRKVTRAKVLVVDDEPTNLQLLTHLLGREGYDVEIAGDAATALEKIKSQRYNLILLDIKLPGMSGIELYENMQKIARSLSSRVLFITGDSMAADTMEFLSRTKAPHITKPFDIKKLKRTVSRMLAQS